MKKITLLVFACIALVAANAQTQRKKTTVVADSTTAAAAPTKTRGQKKEMMKELNLTSEQKGKLKEMHRVNKGKIAALQSNDKLTEAEKKEQLKALKKEQLKATLELLNDEQKAKLKAQQKNNRKNNDDMPLMDDEL